MGTPELLVQALRQQQPPALFYQELATRLRPAGLTAADLQGAIDEMEARSEILTIRYPAPDPHLEGFDLRVVALVGSEGEAEALHASQAVWSDWLRQFLANHRCQ